MDFLHQSSIWRFQSGPLTLVITNYVIGKTKLRFGTDSTGLTTDQLSQIQFANYNNASGKSYASGFVTPNAPVISSVTKNNESVSLVWQAINGKTYRVVFKLNLTDASWTALTPDVTASETRLITWIRDGHHCQRFYRVDQLP